MLRRDTARLAALAKLGDDLLAAGETVAGEHGEDDMECAARAGWASSLRSGSYQFVQQDDGSIVVEFEAPPEVLSALASSNESITRGEHAWALVTRYGARDDRRAVTDTLSEDLAFVRGMIADPAEPFGPPLAEVVAAVSATALVRTAGREVSLPPEEMDWAAACLADVSLARVEHTYATDSARYAVGAMRSVACGLPALLLSPSMAASLGVDRIAEALVACARFPSDEVRRVLAASLEPVWEAGCSDAGTDGCRHRLALKLAQEMLWDCQLGDWDETGQRRTVKPLTGDPAEALALVDADALQINRLTAAIATTMAAARSAACVSCEARQFQDVLLAAYLRGAMHWDEEGYGSHTGDEHRPVARALFIAAANCDPEPLARCILEFADHPRLVEQLLHNILVLCTYDHEMRASLAVVWPGVMRAGLDSDATDEAERGRRGERAAAAVIPRPSIDIADGDPNQTLAVAQREWIDITLVADLVEEWIPGVQGGSHAVDAVLGLIETGDPNWQSSAGLEWIECLIGGDYPAIALHSWGLPSWLERLRGAATLDPVATARFHRIVDGLAAAGDHRVVALQRADE